MRVGIGVAVGVVLVATTPIALATLAAAPPATAAAPGVPAELWTTVVAAAGTCGLAPEVLAAQLERESAWRPDALSPAGAQGLAQFMPGTWTSRGVDANGDGRADPFDPVDAIWSAALYDCHLLALVRAVPGDPYRLMLAAYNAGPSAVLQHGGLPPFPETIAYVAAVLKRAAELTAEPATGLTPRAERVQQLVAEVFGVTDIGGFAKDGHVAGSDHYTGRAVDILLLPLGPESTALGWRIAIHLQSNARPLGITYLIWQGRIWSVARAAEGWRPYRHPSGGTNSTLMHLDHIHVSVA